MGSESSRSPAAWVPTAARPSRSLVTPAALLGGRSVRTGPEQALRKSLWSRGIRYRVQVALPGRPDLAIPRARLLVFVDGCFWHGCPTHYRAPRANARFWAEKRSVN